MSAESKKYWRLRSWHTAIKLVIARMVKRNSSPVFKRQFASVLESQATALRAFADTQPQKVKVVLPVSRLAASFLVEHPDCTVREFAEYCNVSIYTASKWRRQFNAERGIIGRLRGRPKKGSIHAR
jgi:hypothetical protein